MTFDVFNQLFDIAEIVAQSLRRAEFSKSQAHKNFVGVEVEDFNFVVGDDRDARALVGLIRKIRRDGAGV